MGGTCVIRGCIPKKLLVYASQFSENVKDAAGYGWDFGDAKFAWPTLIANKDREIARLEGLYTKNVEAAGVEDPGRPRRLRGSAYFAAAQFGQARHGGENPDRHRQPHRPANWAPATSFPAASFASPPTRPSI